MVRVPRRLKRRNPVDEIVEDLYLKRRKKAMVELI